MRDRFNEPTVLIYDEERPYRPSLLSRHIDFKEIYVAEARPKEVAVPTS